MAYFRCIGGNGGGQIAKKINGRFGTTNGIVLVEGRYLSNLDSTIYMPVTENNAAPVYDLTKPMKIHMRFKCASQNYAAQALVAADSSTYGRPRIEFCGTQYNDILMTAGWTTNGSSWNSWLTINKSSVPYSANSWYTADYVWDGTTFSFTVSDGEHSATASAAQSQFYPSNNNIVFGKSSTGGVPANKITFDLFDCYYEQDGVIIWGNKA